MASEPQPPGKGGEKPDGQAATPVEGPRSEAQTVPSGPVSDEEQFLVSGRVVGPDGKPFAGAKVFAVVRSNESKAPRLKDPKQPLFEVQVSTGQTPLLKFVHPRIVELLKKFNIETTVASDDPRLRSPELEKAYAALASELYEFDPTKKPPLRATSGADGRFRFALVKADLKPPFEEDVSVIAVADGFGPGWNLSHAGVASRCGAAIGRRTTD